MPGMEMEPRTHLGIDHELCGTPRLLEPGVAEVVLVTGERMVADDLGLVHGGFVVGLADHAAMLAVNEPTVVLGRAQFEFSRPVVLGQELCARAELERSEGKKRWVRVEVKGGDETVMQGEFLCIVPERHVLDRA